MQPLQEEQQWRQRWNNINVFRSLFVYNCHREPVHVGPFYVDIDADRDEFGVRHYEGALHVARLVIDLLRQRGAAEPDMRVWFTGHKGFNVEARPEALGLPTHPASALAAWACLHEEVLDALRKQTGTAGHPVVNQVGDYVYLDTIVKRSPPHELKHSYLRLPGSINVWIEDGGTKRGRMKRIMDFHLVRSEDASALRELLDDFVLSEDSP